MRLTITGRPTTPAGHLPNRTFERDSDLQGFEHAADCGGAKSPAQEQVGGLEQHPASQPPPQHPFSRNGSSTVRSSFRAAQDLYVGIRALSEQPHRGDWLAGGGCSGQSRVYAWVLGITGPEPGQQAQQLISLAGLEVGA